LVLQEENLRPNFIVIGAARSGTTSLHKYLEAHPDIFMSDIKEINFFSNQKYWQKGIDWYKRHFARANHTAVGEASTSYTNFPLIKNVPKRMHTFLPHAKLIYIVRDPIDRFISHYLQRIRRGAETRKISDIVENHPDDHLLWQGRYFAQLEQFLSYYPFERFLLLTIDDLKNTPNETVMSIYRFLGVDDSFINADFSVTHNANKRTTQKNWFGRKVFRFYEDNVEQVNFPYTFKKMFFRLAELGARPIEKPVLSEDQVRTLQEYYACDIDSLQKISGKDLGGWRSYTVSNVAQPVKSTYS
jgi:hypothetical protein